jgi:hypothetical protein
LPNWREEASELLEVARYKPLRILVWGPGHPGGNAAADKLKLYNKRVQIKTVLRAQFPHSTVFMSEDQEMQELVRGIKGKLLQEAFQARTADLVLMLDTSGGVHLELDHFVPTYPWFRHKTYVLLPEEHVPPKGLAAEVFNYLTPDHVIGFSQAEFDNCTVVTQKAVNIATTVAVDQLLREK